MRTGFDKHLNLLIEYNKCIDLVTDIWLNIKDEEIIFVFTNKIEQNLKEIFRLGKVEEIEKLFNDLNSKIDQLQTDISRIEPKTIELLRKQIAVLKQAKTIEINNTEYDS